MISKENSNPLRKKGAGASHAVERPGEGVKSSVTSAASGAAVAAAPEPARAVSAGLARAAYVPTRRRSRRNLLL